MSKDRDDYEEAVRTAERARIQAVKEAKQTLNATIKTSYVEVIERAWNDYDQAVREAWRVHDAIIEAAQRGEATKQPCALTHAVLERTAASRDDAYHLLNN